MIPPQRPSPQSSRVRRLWAWWVPLVVFLLAPSCPQDTYLNLRRTLAWGPHGLRLEAQLRQIQREPAVLWLRVLLQEDVLAQQRITDERLTPLARLFLQRSPKAERSLLRVCRPHVTGLQKKLLEETLRQLDKATNNAQRKAQRSQIQRTKAFQKRKRAHIAYKKALTAYRIALAAYKKGRKHPSSRQPPPRPRPTTKPKPRPRPRRTTRPKPRPRLRPRPRPTTKPGKPRKRPKPPKPLGTKERLQEDRKTMLAKRRARFKARQKVASTGRILFYARQTLQTLEQLRRSVQTNATRNKPPWRWLPPLRTFATPLLRLSRRLPWKEAPKLRITFRLREGDFSAVLLLTSADGKFKWPLLQNIPSTTHAFVRRLRCAQRLCLLTVEHGSKKPMTARSTYLLHFRPDRQAARLRNLQGYKWHDQKRYKRALKAFDQAALWDPTFGDAIYNKACAHALQKQPHKALKALRKAITLDEQYRRLACVDKDFKPIRAFPPLRKLLGCPKKAPKKKEL